MVFYVPQLLKRFPNQNLLLWDGVNHKLVWVTMATKLETTNSVQLWLVFSRFDTSDYLTIHSRSTEHHKFSGMLFIMLNLHHHYLVKLCLALYGCDVETLSVHRWRLLKQKSWFHRFVMKLQILL